jgi:predicted PurR-regulated permease PerM
MMEKRYPFYLRSTIILFGLTLLIYGLLNLKEILIPLAFSIMLAILLNPMNNRLQQRKIPPVLSISLSMLAGLIIITGAGYFLTTQLASLGDQLPLLKRKFWELFQRLQKTVATDLGYPIRKQNQFLDQAEAGMRPLLGQTLGTVMGTLNILILLPVYTFLFLYYKKLILNFLYEIFAEENSEKVAVILQQTKGAIQSYMVGLLLEGLIVASLNTVALLLLGVDFALLLGVLGAILNVLPYIGGIIAIGLPVIMATITKDGFHTQLGVIAAYLVIQFIDNHFLVPLVVSSKVRINALISIVAVLLGGALWGISGMFLSIPIIGVIKIICDRVDDLKPWGKLLGDEIPTKHKGQLLLRSIRKKKPITEKKVS